MANWGHILKHPLAIFWLQFCIFVTNSVGNKMSKRPIAQWQFLFISSVQSIFVAGKKYGFLWCTKLWLVVMVNLYLCENV